MMLAKTIEIVPAKGFGFKIIEVIVQRGEMDAYSYSDNNYIASYGKMDEMAKNGSCSVYSTVVAVYLYDLLLLRGISIKSFGCSASNSC